MRDGDRGCDTGKILRKRREKRRTGDHLARDVPLQRVEIDELAEGPGAAPNEGFGTHVDLEKNGDGSDTENRERQGDFTFGHRV